MTYECCCADITVEELEKKMEGSKPINYKWLVGRIRKQLPSLYQELSLQMYNPWEENCCVTKERYVLVHSAIEYFILKK